MPQQRYFATILLQTPGCATLIKDNIGFKLYEITKLLYLSMLIPNLIWQTCLLSLCSEKLSQIYETRFYMCSQDIVDSNNQQCHVWGGEFEIKIGLWPVMSNPSLDRRLLACDLYIVLCYCCKGVVSEEFQVCGTSSLLWCFWAYEADVLQFHWVVWSILSGMTFYQGSLTEKSHISDSPILDWLTRHIHWHVTSVSESHSQSITCTLIN